MNQKSEWQQSKDWEELFQKVIVKAQLCPARSLFLSDYISADKIADASGNHVFDDHPDFWGISQTEGHEIRAVFQYYSTRSNKEFKQYIQDLIDSAMDRHWELQRLQS